jgi:invasion protein IalB
MFLRCGIHPGQSEVHQVPQAWRIICASQKTFQTLVDVVLFGLDSEVLECPLITFSALAA